MIRQSKTEGGTARESEECTPTAGAVCGKAMLELVRAPSASEQLSLLLWGKRKLRIAPRIQRNDKMYVPLSLEARLAQGIRFPNGSKAYGSTRNLFAKICGLFETWCGLPPAAASLATHFVLATFFADCFQTAPSLVLFGSAEPEATRLLRLLGCLCYHSLLVADVAPAGLLSLPPGLSVTLLIGQPELSPATRRLLHVSRLRNFGVLRAGKLLDLCHAIVLYAAQSGQGDEFTDGSLQIHISPTVRALPPLTMDGEQEIAAQFQPRLLAYRLANYDKVLCNAFDAPELTGNIRESARNLGCCIIGAPELQAGVMSLLRAQEELALSAQVWRPECVVLEALLVLCHETGHESVLIGEVTKLVNGILTGRGESLELQPRKLGHILRSLGVFTQRGAKGYGFYLSNDAKRHLHELAVAYRVPSVSIATEGCSHCAELVGGAGRPSPNECCER